MTEENEEDLIDDDDDDSGCSFVFSKDEKDVDFLVRRGTMPRCHLYEESRSLLRYR